MTETDFNQPFLPILGDSLRKFADRPCLVFKGETLSYADVDRQSARIANRLIAEGFQPGMKGAVYSQNSAISFIATLGMLRAGGVWIPINPRNSEADNIAVLEQFQCSAIFYQQTYAEAIGGQVRPRGKSAPISVCFENDDGLAPGLEEWVGKESDVAPAIEVSPTDLISIPLTGGTTGTPKGVMLSNRNFFALDYGMRDWFEGSKPVLLCAAPLTHATGRFALCGLSSGTRSVILEAVDIQQVLHTIQEERITHLFLPPTAVYTLLDQPNLDDFDLSSLEHLLYGSAPMSIPRLKEALRRIGPVMRGGFGQTECPMFITRLLPREHFVDNDIRGEIAPDERLRSVGRATPIATIAILDEEGNELPARERGEIAVKGPMMSEGYYEAPEETAKIRQHGWHLTGDIGYLNEEGFLYVVDRKKDMIISGGFNVYSSEVEYCLMNMQGVDVAVVIGVPDEKWGEAVAAYVQLQPGSRLSDTAIIDRAKAELGGVKAPKQVTFVDDFPRTAVGKIDKKQIRNKAWAGYDHKI